MWLASLSIFKSHKIINNFCYLVMKILIKIKPIHWRFLKQLNFLLHFKFVVLFLLFLPSSLFFISFHLQRQSCVAEHAIKTALWIWRDDDVLDSFFFLFSCVCWVRARSRLRLHDGKTNLSKEHNTTHLHTNVLLSVNENEVVDRN